MENKKSSVHVHTANKWYIYNNFCPQIIISIAEKLYLNLFNFKKYCKLLFRNEQFSVYVQSCI